MFDGSDFNQFQGGGFLQESQQATTTQTPQAFSNQPQTIRCCTVKRILEAFQQSQDDRLYLDSQMIHTVSLCGQLKQVNSGDFTMFTIQDSTGNIQAKSWDSNLPTDIQQGDWIRTFGHIKSPENPGEQPYLMAFLLRKVTDPMEITYHNQRVIYEHLLLSKYGGGTKPINQEGQMNQGNMGNFTPQQQQFGGRNLQSPGVAATQYGNTDLENAIVNMVKNCAGGIHVDKIMEQLGGRFQPHQIKSAIDNVKFSGRVFTSDDSNWLKHF
eukprot:TRINITY_DN3252_c0_g1_i3.p1 TRINITY_DN3252_c0_g1~~TRINITY_DN3252_c0_g1_i3.p1  ORF type:complete len:269 (-),score=23.88 TRINITY_DN3252_c0_g1_i3:737-1543(-)